MAEDIGLGGEKSTAGTRGMDKLKADMMNRLGRWVPIIVEQVRRADDLCYVV